MESVETDALESALAADCAVSVETLHNHPNSSVPRGNECWQSGPGGNFPLDTQSKSYYTAEFSGAQRSEPLGGPRGGRRVSTWIPLPDNKQ